MNKQQTKSFETLAKKLASSKITKDKKPTRKSSNKVELNQSFSFNHTTRKVETV